MRRITLLLSVGLLLAGGLVAAVLSFGSQPLEAQEQHYAQEPGQAWAWGFNYYGQLGDGTTTDSNTPVEVQGLTDAVSVAAGGFHNLALKQDGRVVSWGYNGLGQLGNGTTADSNTPVEVQGLTDAVAVAVGGAHSLALKQDGTVVAWGYNESGQLGDGTHRIVRYLPVEVEGLTDAVAIAAGESHSLAVKSDGTVVAWGWNFDGHLGDGTTTNRSTPVEVQGLTDAVAIAGGFWHSLAIEVKDASEQLADQIALINSYNLHPPVQKALVATLQATLEAVDAGDTARADKQLRAYIRQVEAQNGKALTEEQANDLIEAANRIRAELGV